MKKLSKLKRCSSPITLTLLASLLIFSTPTAVYAEGGTNNYPYTPVGESPILNTDHFFTVELHAGEQGYFGDPEIKDTTSSPQYDGDTFKDYTTPDPIDYNEWMFLGWVSDPDNLDSTVAPGVNQITDDITDLYAVWTDHILVTYNGSGNANGYVEDEDGHTHSALPVKMDLNAFFDDSLTGTPANNQYTFNGWYTSQGCSGDKLDSTYPLNRFTASRGSLDVYACYDVNTDDVTALPEDTQIDVAEGGDKLFSYVPEETTVYKFETYDTETTYGTQSYLFLYDENFHMISNITRAHEPDVEIVYLLDAGKTYYLQVSELRYNEMSTFIRITTPDYATVTYHANPAEGYTAYFDDNETKLSKNYAYTLGYNVSNIQYYEIGMVNERGMVFHGWSTNPDAISGETIFVNEDVDVYAVWEYKDVVTYSPDEGYFSWTTSGDENLYADYYDDDIFEGSLYDPKSYDDEQAFVGWATTRDATEPNVFEGHTAFGDIEFEDPDNPTLYAVYGEKVSVVFTTWDDDGGYYLQNPNKRTYKSVAGKGRVFYGLTAYNLDYNKQAIFYVDQEGEEIEFTFDYDPDYRLKGDSVFKPVWGYLTALMSNGGYWYDEEDYDGFWVPLRIEGGFRNESVLETIGKPTHPDPNKYLAGWAYEQDATEPDVEEGTPVEDLYEIWAVWKDDEYYFAENENPTWTRGSGEDLQITVKRQGDDELTYDNFTNLTIDGETATEGEAYEKARGSLILTLKADYLETLGNGGHELAFLFTGASLSTTLTIVEEEAQPTEDSKETPTTPDTGINSVTEASATALACSGLTSIMALATYLLIHKKRA